MSKSLVIVESPSKAKTINKYLGKDFKVIASVGHIKDLPKKGLGVDIENNFEPTYEVMPGKEKVVREIKEAAKEAETVYVATDPDREGEAIGWHIAETDHRDARDGAQADLPRDVQRDHQERGQGRLQSSGQDQRQPGRRATGAPRARSPGRLQSQPAAVGQGPARAFGGARADRGRATGRRARTRDSGLRQNRILDDHRESCRRSCRRRSTRGSTRSIDRRSRPPASTTASRRPNSTSRTKRPRKAFWPNSKAHDTSSPTSRPKRRSATRFRPSSPRSFSRRPRASCGFRPRRRCSSRRSSTKASSSASEGAVGLITYMRTDSTRVAESALAEVREFIARQYGERYLPEKAIHYRSKKDAQDAHEAIRPTSAERTPDQVAPYLDKDELALYRLIWQRFVASQMMPAVFDQTTIDIAAGRLNTRSAPPARCSSSTASSRSTKRARTKRTKKTKSARRKLPKVEKGEAAEAQLAHARISTSPSRRRATPKRRWSRRSKRKASAGPRPTRRS